MEIALEKLPLEERISLAQKIWDSIISDSRFESEKLALSDLHKQIIDERLIQTEQDLSIRNSISNLSKWDDWFDNGSKVTDDFMSERVQPEQEREF